MHRSWLRSASPLERLDAETKRLATVVGIFPNEVAIAPQDGAIPADESFPRGVAGRLRKEQEASPAKVG